MSNAVVFSGADALLALLTSSSPLDWISGKTSPDPCTDLVASISQDETTHFFTSRSTTSQGRIFFSRNVLDYILNKFQSNQATSALQRAHRLVELAKKMPLKVPQDWFEYHARDLVTFFAMPRSLGNFRWIAQISVNEGDVCFWEITSDQETVDLDNFQPITKKYMEAVEDWNKSKVDATSLFSKCKNDASYVSLGGAIDLGATTFDAVVRHKAYSEWLDNLNLQQRQFLAHRGDHSVKLRGPAGSGKTLALSIKALSELYAAEEKLTRILFVTHSWAMAEQIDHILNAIDEKSRASEISVFPLVEIAKSILPRSQSTKTSVLGDDSYTGKSEQLRRISNILEDLRKSEWPLFSLGCSTEFKKRVESSFETPKWNSLVWDIMHEFSAVLGAASIFPGVNAERKYFAIERMDWMMPLFNEGDKRFVLRAYSEYVNGLKSIKMLTVDQLVNDLLNYLETFAWNYRRDDEGYDLIFVDEFHLFSEQERQVLNYLNRDASAFPRLYMALDPRQSPYEVYVNFPISEVTSHQSGQAERDLGEVNSFDLTKVHRFSPQILELVKFIQYSYPTLNLGDDWLLDVRSWESAAPSSEPPKYRTVKNLDEEVSATVQAAKRLFVKNDNSRRLAIILLDETHAAKFAEALEAERLPVLFMESRDDIDNMRYHKKSITLTAAEYAAGLQFDDVIVTALPDHATLTPIPVHQRRRILSLMYLAVSRATENVELIIQLPGDEYTSMFDRAVQSNVLQLIK